MNLLWLLCIHFCHNFTQNDNNSHNILYYAPWGFAFRMQSWTHMVMKYKWILLQYNNIILSLFLKNEPKFDELLKFNELNFILVQTPGMKIWALFQIVKFLLHPFLPNFHCEFNLIERRYKWDKLNDTAKLINQYNYHILELNFKKICHR